MTFIHLKVWTQCVVSRILSPLFFSVHYSEDCCAGRFALYLLILLWAFCWSSLKEYESCSGSTRARGRIRDESLLVVGSVKSLSIWMVFVEWTGKGFSLTEHLDVSRSSPQLLQSMCHLTESDAKAVAVRAVTDLNKWRMQRETQSKHFPARLGCSQTHKQCLKWRMKQNPVWDDDCVVPQFQHEHHCFL